MAEKKCKGYAGKISHSGVQVVKAPCDAKAPKGNSVVKSGDDLRKK